MNTATETANVAEHRPRFSRVPMPQSVAAPPTDEPNNENEVVVPPGKHPDEIQMPAEPRPAEHEFNKGQPAQPQPAEPDYPHRSALPTSQVGMPTLAVNEMALVPVDWLEHLLSRTQVERVLDRRQPPRKVVDATSIKPSKFCAGCSTDKPVGEFYRMASAKDGYQPRCKDCQRADATARRETAPDKSNARGAYALSGKSRNTVRGRATIKKVFEYFKTHKTVTARQLTHDLKIPASTVHRVLNRLQHKQAIAKVAART